MLCLGIIWCWVIDFISFELIWKCLGCWVVLILLGDCLLVMVVVVLWFKVVSDSEEIGYFKVVWCVYEEVV